MTPFGFKSVGGYCEEWELNIPGRRNIAPKTITNRFDWSRLPGRSLTTPCFISNTSHLIPEFLITFIEERKEMLQLNAYKMTCVPSLQNTICLTYPHRDQLPCPPIRQRPKSER